MLEAGWRCCSLQGLREQLTEILQDTETSLGRRRFTTQSRSQERIWSEPSTDPAQGPPVSAKIKKEWQSTKEDIWLPNFFEGKDPFEGKQVEGKGLPAGGEDERGATVLPKQAAQSVDDDSDF